ncbi:putative amino acid transporter, putative,amino acid permease [Trypanosoma conorhini]|uniref:Putative amino acid transporter, putative,amino acid permease n=1 Tax=Trypanosoma conorhini TaxID=83891 RepID=A0A3R7PIF7_9TRYP|nr:putative amino acid transporter, putative,amino acid permease [Trypanosoma conorhini]RNF25751.1 putative amino acid transporter, putative,amino acid permease [Trypanosoma conorhini]
MQAEAETSREPLNLPPAGYCSLEVEFQQAAKKVADTPFTSEEPDEILYSGPREERGEPPSFLSRVKKFTARVLPPGGLVSSVFNLASVCVGAGILGLPAAANSSGLVMAFIYLLIITAFAIYSLHLLGKTMEKTGIRTFENMAKQLIGARFDYFVACVRWVNSFGSTIAYVISVGDILQPMLNNSPGAPKYLKTVSGRRLVTSAVWFFVMLPLVLPKQVNSLRYVSTLAVAFVVYFVIMLVIHSCESGLENIHKVDGETIKLFNTGNAAIKGLGVFMFAFVCQINCFEVYWEMKDRSVRNYTLYAAIAMLLCLLLYVLTVFFGYIEFGSAVESSILLMYNPLSQGMVMAGYVGMLVKLCAAYALQTMACRNAIYHCISWEVETLPYWKHFIAVITLSAVVLLCGLFIPNINTVFGLVGSICGGFLSFVFPSLFYLYSGNWTLKSVGLFDYVATHALLIAGVVGIVFGTIASIYGTATA